MAKPAWGSAANAADNGLARFGTEVTLLGLGADIALARNQPGEARRYLDLLPGALQKVPEWDQRIRNAECISSSQNAERATCLQLTRDDLAKQAQSFVTGI